MTKLERRVAKVKGMVAKLDGTGRAAKIEGWVAK